LFCRPRSNVDMVDDPTTSLGDLPLICTRFQDVPGLPFVRSTRPSVCAIHTAFRLCDPHGPPFVRSTRPSENGDREMEVPGQIRREGKREAVESKPDAKPRGTAMSTPSRLHPSTAPSSMRRAPGKKRAASRATAHNIFRMAMLAAVVRKYWSCHFRHDPAPVVLPSLTVWSG